MLINIANVSRKSQGYKFLMSLVLVCTISTVSVRPAQATGFPTVDIAAIIQNIIAYITELSDYAESITQTTTQVDQLVSMYEEYQQMLQEYQHYLNQLQGLRNQISNADWNTLTQFVTDITPYISDLSVTIGLDPTSPNYETQLRTILRSEGMAPNTTDGVVDSFTVDLGVQAQKMAVMEQRIQRLNRDYDRYASQHEVAAISEEGRKTLFENVELSQSRFEALGDESDLQTAQLGVANQLTMMKQNDLMLKNQAVTLQHYEPVSTVINRTEADDIDREIARLQSIQGRANFLSGETNFANTGL